MMNFYAMTNIGMQRTKNQDQATVLKNDFNQIIAIVCDGMGGHKAGEIASSLVNDYFIDAFNKINYFEDIEHASKWLNDTIQTVHQVVFNQAKNDGGLEGMGTTIVVALILNQQVIIAHVGDSRAYLYKKNELKQLTKDHSFVNELLDRGAISQSELEHHSNRNMLLQAIGAIIEIKVSICHQIVTNGILLLCSDGLYNMLSNQKMIEIIEQHQTMEEIGDCLIKEANLAGGKDNIAVVLVDVTGGNK